MELKDIIKDDWKVIDDFPRYLISNRGEVFSITSNKVLRVGINKGYAKVVLCNSATGNNKTIEIHRLVAKAFVNNPNPNEFVQVNHKDENTLNNNANNLEWCTASYNANYGTRTIRMAQTQGHSIKAFKNGVLVGTFYSQSKCARELNISQPGVNRAVRGLQKTVGGYTFEYDI